MLSKTIGQLQEKVVEQQEVKEEVDESEPVNEEVLNQPEFVVGDTVQIGNLELTLNSVRFDEGTEYFKPDEGEKWLVLDCTIKNIGEETESISSMLMFDLYDSDFYSKDTEIFAETKGSLDGELSLNRTMRGEIAFGVGSSETEWEFIFEPELFSYGQAIFKITSNDIK